jgi:membrane fusion protein (multidrug efflux system)
MRGASRRTLWWGGALVLAVALLLVGVTLSRLGFASRGPVPDTAAAEPLPSAANAVPVTVASIVPRKIQRSVQVVGTFHGYDEVTVMAEVAGRVCKVHREVGDVVRPGDVLLEIDPTDYQLSVEETRRALELEAARIGITPPPENEFRPDKILAKLNREFDLEKLPAVLRAKQQEDNAKARLDRAKQLRESNAITAEEYEQRATDYQVALATRIQMEMDSRAIVAAIKHKTVLLKVAERKLQLTKVVAPEPTKREGMPSDVEYVVAERKVTEGEMLKDSPGSSTATFELVMDKVLKLTAAVPERYAGAVRVGQKAEVRVESYPGRVFAGVVSRVNPMVNRLSRTFEVEVRVDNPKRELKAGGFAKIDILTHEDPDAWTVPIEAVVSFVGSTKIFVVRDGKAHAILVSPGQEGQGWIEIVRAASPELRLEDQVITSGLEKLAEGAPVRVREPDKSK